MFNCREKQVVGGQSFPNTCQSCSILGVFGGETKLSFRVPPRVPCKLLTIRHYSRFFIRSPNIDHTRSCEFPEVDNLPVRYGITIRANNKIYALGRILWKIMCQELLLRPRNGARVNMFKFLTERYDYPLTLVMNVPFGYRERSREFHT